MDAFPVLILGASRIGQRIATMLAQDVRFSPIVTCRDKEALADFARVGLPTVALAGSGFRDDLGALLGRVQAVILTDGSTPAAEVAELAREKGCHYLDIIESTASGEAVASVARKLPDDSALCFAPGCGLAPGYVTALVADALNDAGPGAEITVFVGVLPANPTNRLGYANIWGVDGLIGEYTDPCLAIRGGALVTLPALTEPEQVRLAGREYEAFTTAGSLDALARSHAGQIGSLVFKTLRYPGHLDYMRFLLEDMGLGQRLYQLRSLMKTTLPHTDDDAVLIAIRCRPALGEPEHWSEHVLHAHHCLDGQVQSAIGTLTAAHVCAMADLICTGKIDRHGLIAPGDIRQEILRSSRFFDLVDPVGLAEGAA